jgi:hypothetical protein
MKYTVEARKKFLVGSRNFFEDIDGFVSKDRDELWILKEPLFGKEKSFIFKNKNKGKDLILYPPFSKTEFIKYDLEKNDKMKFGKYLVKEFAEYIGLTIEDLKNLKIIYNT